MYQARKKTFLFHSIKRHFTSTITALTNLQTSTNTNAKTKLIPNGIANIKAKPNTKNPSSTKNTIGNAKFIEHIQRFCKEGRLNQAVGILKDMDRQGVRAEVSAYASLLQCCLETKSVAQGRKVHNHMIENGFSLDLFLVNIGRVGFFCENLGAGGSCSFICPLLLLFGCRSRKLHAEWYLGVVIQKPSGENLRQVQKKFYFYVDGTVAEHLALMDGLLATLQLNVPRV
ncbi:hypothetical protein SUGI_1096980 [Cryptomeria japonica]|nr:hypothetical protein SUGI_1096980 [Cryptomeria japonica]